MNLHKYPKDHPIWTIITHGMYGVVIIGGLAWNASNFDSTEMKTISQIFIAVGGAEWIKSKIRSKASEPEPVTEPPVAVEELEA